MTDTVAIDPVTLEVIRSGMPAIANEMSYDLMRTSYNMMIYEVHDYCCTIVDDMGRLYAQNVGGVSHFVADMGVVIKDGIEKFGLDGFEPGDVILMNHQSVCGQHLNNVVVYTPFFFEGKLTAFPAARAHWIDVGGLSTGSGGAEVFDPWAEGLQFNQVKIYRAGVLDEGIKNFICDNLRFPEGSMGDLRSQIAACRLAERRLTDLYTRYGPETVKAAMEMIFAQSEQHARSIIETIPDGVYEAESYFDYQSATGPADPLKIGVKVTVEGSDMEIDLSNCPPQQTGTMNSRTLAGAFIPYKALTSPDEPANEGAFAGLKAIVPEGSIMMAKHPASMAGWSLIIPAVVDTVMAALSKALPDQVPAAHLGFIGLAKSFTGLNPLRNNRRFIVTTLDGGGWGGRSYEDGPSGVVSVTQGDVRNAPIESLELKAPIIIEERALARDSGGPGKFRGGLAVRLTIKNRIDGRWSLNKDRRTYCPPWGIYGGDPGRSGTNFIKLPEDADWKPTNQAKFFADAGTTVQGTMNGGGGWGDAIDRDPERVLVDLLDEYVSIEGARNDYGVVIDPETETIDYKATETLRAEMRKQPRGLTAEWLESHGTVTVK